MVSKIYLHISSLSFHSTYFKLLSYFLCSSNPPCIFSRSTACYRLSANSSIPLLLTTCSFYTQLHLNHLLHPPNCRFAFQVKSANKQTCVLFLQVFKVKAPQYFNDLHLVRSLIYKPSYSHFTRLQRLLCVFTGLMLHVCLSAAYYYYNLQVTVFSRCRNLQVTVFSRSHFSQFYNELVSWQSDGNFSLNHSGRLQTDLSEHNNI